MVNFFLYDGNSSSGGFSQTGKFLMPVLEVILKVVERERGWVEKGERRKKQKKKNFYKRKTKFCQYF